MPLMQHVEVPVPSAKKNELLLKLEAASINPVDWKMQKGMLRPLLPRKLPFIPGNHPYSSSLDLMRSLYKWMDSPTDDWPFLSLFCYFSFLYKSICALL
jgi:hypothetical protein